MNEKRRDNKGRVLRNGETQRQDGKYEFKYSDSKGIRRSVYSWKLVSTDSLPPGKRWCEPLRDIEKRVLRDTDDGIDTHTGQRTTLNDFYNAYISIKYELKSSTRTNYKYMYSKYVRDTLGIKKISGIKYSDVRAFYVSLIKEKGFKPNSVEIIQTILHPVFGSAVRDGILRLNPTDGVIAEIKRSHDWVKPKRHPLTIAQQERFIQFVSESPIYNHWMTVFTVMLGTGARVGEVLGLRWADCNFAEGIIDINHNLIYRVQEDTGKCAFMITTTKTEAGTRIIPMFQDVRRALLTELERQRKEGFNSFVVDGYAGFVFANRFNEPLSPHCLNRALERIIRDANEEETENAKREKRAPVLLPHFTCHHLRHTFCTRLCEKVSNIKVIQEIMGHASSETTMDIYNEATKDLKIQTFESLEGAFRIA